MYYDQRSQYIRLNSKKNSFRGNYSRKYGNLEVINDSQLMNVFIYFLFQTNLGGQHNAYHGFFYVEEHPPPPPPHAYELQQGYHPQTHQMVAYPQGK